MVAALVALTASAFLGGAGAAVVEVKLGTTVERTWEQVKAAKFAYGPKQEYVAATGETHIYLPYGKSAQRYAETRGVLSDPEAGSLALFNSSTGEDDAVLTYKLHFDQRIGTLRFWAGWSELGLAKKGSGHP
jgi:hypothetical protein